MNKTAAARIEAEFKLALRPYLNGLLPLLVKQLGQVEVHLHCTALSRS